MMGFCALAPLGDSIAKVLGDTVPLGQLLIVRFAAQAVLLLPIIVLARRPVRMSQRVFILMVIRTILHMLGIGAMFAALRYLPLADAVAIAFVMPFIMLLLGRFVLNEQIGIHRLSACAVGFAGTLLVIQPNFATVGAPALLPLAVAVIFAFFMLVTRQIAKETDPISLQAISGIVATILLAILFWATDGDEWPAFEMIMPSTVDMMLLAAIGLIGTLAHLLMTWSLRFAPSATLAPMQYLEIPFATLIGWIVFLDLPDGLASIGIAITMAAGLYIIYREHAAARPLPMDA